MEDVTTRGVKRRYNRARRQKEGRTVRAVKKDQYVPNLPERADDGLAVGPAQYQELAQHPSAETDAAPSCALAANCGNEVRIACAVLWERDTEEVAIGRVDISVECDARLGVSVGRRRLCGSKADKGEKGRKLHCSKLRVNKLLMIGSRTARYCMVR